MPLGDWIWKTVLTTWKYSTAVLDVLVDTEPYRTVAIQSWLGLRLEFFGNLLLLGIGLFAAGQRNSVNPAKVGVVLSYSLSSKSPCLNTS
jgi:hypothetical protein